MRGSVGKLIVLVLAGLVAVSATDVAARRSRVTGPSAVAGKTSNDAKATRANLLENKLFGADKLLFVKRYTYHSSHFYTDFIDGVGNFGGNLCVLDLRTGKVTDLVPEMKKGIFGRFDLHFSAKRIVFDWKKAPREGFRLFEIDIDPTTGLRTDTKVRQLTFPPDDEQARIKKYDNSFLGGTGRMYYHQTDDMHPCYLPDGGIIFTSTRCEFGTLCDAPDILSTAVIHRIDGDGKNMQMLTNSPVSEFSPSMLADGRIIYTRWEYVDKGQLGVKCLWAMRPDGTGTVEVYGNDIQFPPTMLHGRQIPGHSDMYVMLGTPHYPQSGIGTVIRLDMTRNIRTREPMTYITPHVDVRQEPGWNHLVNGKWVRHTNGPLYMDPYPLSKELYLVSHNPDKPWKDMRAYGLYTIREGGAHALIYKDQEFSCWQPYPLKTRKAPPVLPSTRDEKLAKRNLALCMVQDVYHGMEGVKRGEVRYLRIMEQVRTLAVKVMRGVVPVYEDGSAHFYVPADKNTYFQALDENYMEIQRERTYVNYRPGERRSCVGCHETPNDSLPKRARTTIAQRKAPSVPPAGRQDGRADHPLPHRRPARARQALRAMPRREGPRRQTRPDGRTDHVVQPVVREHHAAAAGQDYRRRLGLGRHAVPRAQERRILREQVHPAGQEGLYRQRSRAAAGRLRQAHHLGRRQRPVLRLLLGQAERRVQGPPQLPPRPHLRRSDQHQSPGRRRSEVDAARLL